jgi:hypothetical protein
MRVVHRLEVVATCPSDGKGDRYDCQIEADRIIKVEDIMALAQKYESMTIYQEDIAVEMASELRARVKLTGTHFGRVHTTVEAG